MIICNDLKQVGLLVRANLPDVVEVDDLGLRDVEQPFTVNMTAQAVHGLVGRYGVYLVKNRPKVHKFLDKY